MMKILDAWKNTKNIKIKDFDLWNSSSEINNIKAIQSIQKQDFLSTIAISIILLSGFFCLLLNGFYTFLSINDFIYYFIHILGLFIVWKAVVKTIESKVKNKKLTFKIIFYWVWYL